MAKTNNMIYKYAKEKYLDMNDPKDEVEDLLIDYISSRKWIEYLVKEIDKIYAEHINQVQSALLYKPKKQYIHDDSDDTEPDDLDECF